MSDSASRREQEPVLERLLRRLASIDGRLEAIQAEQRDAVEQLRNRLGTVEEGLALLYDDDPTARRRLRAVRSDPSYAAAFADPLPLVSVVIPTWNRVDTLVERSIASALAQTHENIEVIVVGDASPPATADAIAALDDDRVAFHNLTFRGPYSENAGRAWLAAGTPGLNAGAALARGAWIAALGDDDAFVPEHVAHLLDLARADRLEFVYGRLRMHTPDGVSLLGEFPPRLGQIGLQATLYHSGLADFMELELAHAVFNKPNDWGLVERMMRVGVRMGMLDEATVDYFPSTPPRPDR